MRPTHLTRFEISQEAQAWHHHTCERNNEQLARNLGITVEYDFKHECTTWKVGPTTLWMGTAPTHTAETDRYNMLMGVGFRHLHGQRVEGTVSQFDTDEQAKQLMREPVWFATGALMPADVFEQALVQTKGSVLQLWDKFKVRPEEIVRRAQSLELDGLLVHDHRATAKPPRM